MIASVNYAYYCTITRCFVTRTDRIIRLLRVLLIGILKVISGKNRISIALDFCVFLFVKKQSPPNLLS